MKWVSRSQVLGKYGSLECQKLILGTPESTPFYTTIQEWVFLAGPLSAGYFIGDLNSLVIRVLQVHTNGDVVIGNTIDFHILIPEPLSQFLEVVQTLHHPSRVVQAYVILQRGRCIVCHLHQSYSVKLLDISRNERRPSKTEIAAM